MMAPFSMPSMVINALRGLNSKFSAPISTLTGFNPLPDSPFVRNYLPSKMNNTRSYTSVSATAFSAIIFVFTDSLEYDE
jgi:hypothetical protein